MKTYIIWCGPAGKIFVPEIWAKMFSANQIAGYFNQPYLQNKIAWFFACWYKLTKIKSRLTSFWLGMVKNEFGQSGLWTLSQKIKKRTVNQKLTVPQERTDETKCFFACWCKSRKTKSYFNEFWVGMVRNGHGYLIHEALKSAVSKDWVYEFSYFFACWLWGSNFSIIILYIFEFYGSCTCQTPSSSLKGPTK